MTTDVSKESDRFTISVDGEPAGFTQFREEDGHRNFFHTELDDAFAGQGLSSLLVQQALDTTRADGLRIIATCPLVKHWLTKHPEFDDIVD